LVLPATFVDASSRLKPPCDARIALNKNSFVVKRFGGGPSLPSDLQSNLLVLVQPEDERTPNQKVKISSGMKGNCATVGKSDRKLAVVTGCRADLAKSQPTSTSSVPEQLF